MAEELRLEATVVDKFSKPLTDLRKKLTDIKSPDGTRVMRREFDAARGSMTRLTDSVNVGLGGALTRLGAIIGGVAGGFYAVSASVRRFTDEIPRLQSVSRETGVSLNNIRALSAVARQVNIDAGDVERGVKTLADNLHDMVRRRGSVWVELLKVAPNLAQQMREAGVEGDVDKALDVALDAVMQIRRTKGAVEARRYSELIFGVDLSRFGEMTRAELKAALAKAMEGMAVTDEMAKNATTLQRSFNALKDTISGIGDAAANSMAPGLTAVTKAFDELLTKEGPVKTFMERTFREINAVSGVLAKILNGTATLDDFIPPDAPIRNLPPFTRPAPKAAQPPSQSQIDGARNRLSAMEEWLRDNPDAAGTPFGRGVLRNKMELEEELRRMERAVKEGASSGIKDGLRSERMERSGFQPAAFNPDAPDDNMGLGPLWRRVPGAGGFAGGSRGGFGGGGSGDFPGAAGEGPEGGVGGKASASASLMARARRVYDRLRSLKWTHEAAAAALGNAQAESSVGTTVNRREGAAGLIHWRLDRLTRLKRFAASRGENGIGSLETQADFLDWEARHGGQSRTGHLIPGMKDIGQANAHFRAFIRYGTNTQGSRAALGYRFGRAFAGSAPGTAPDYTPGSAFKSAREARGEGGPSGAAKLDVTLNNFPAGWRARAEGGTLFRDVEVNRGRSMVPATEDAQ